MKRNLLLLLLVAFVIAGSGCTIFDAFLIAVNIEGISGTYGIDPGPNPNYGPPDDCVTILPDDYLNPDFSDQIEEVLIYDILVQNAGAHTGTVNMGEVTVNGQVVLRYSGPWDVFMTPQSLLQALTPGGNPYITPEPGGIGILINAILNREIITLCSSGSLSDAPVPPGLSVIVTVLGQVKVEP